MLRQAPQELRKQCLEIEAEQISMRRRCTLLSINRSSIYYKAKGSEVADIDLINAIREVWERRPYYGYRRVTKELKAQGYGVNRKRVQRLMQVGGIKAIYPGPNTSWRNKFHAIHPYLLGGLTVFKANQAWQVDITYLRLGQGFVYLVALIDVYSRYVVGWQISITLETEFCIEALKMGLLLGIPEIINSDQGSQFTSNTWVDFLKEKNIAISMTGKGRCIDNIYIERFWRSVKREEFYLNDYSTVAELKEAIGAYIDFYNHKRWHQSLDYKTPAEVYFGGAKEGKPVDIWTSPSEQAAPVGSCGQAMDNANALPTA